MRSAQFLLRRSLLAVVVATLPLLGTTSLGCAKTQNMHSGAGVPASEGTVKATEGDNGNTNLDIRVAHLAQPSRVEGDSTVYVVWITPRNAASQNVGALVVNDDLEGRLELMTPHRAFRLTVTPEPSGMVSAPSHDPVFTSDIDRSE